MSPPTKKFKRPESVLVVVYTLTGKVLLLRRADDPDFWQSVTGSLLWEETGLEATETLQEAGLTHRYKILPKWRSRYAPEVKENTEHVYFLALPAEKVITLNSAEHTEYGWYSFDEAASKVFSWTNREAILKAKGQHLK